MNVIIPAIFLVVLGAVIFVVGPKAAKPGTKDNYSCIHFVSFAYAIVLRKASWRNSRICGASSSSAPSAAATPGPNTRSGASGTR